MNTYLFNKNRCSNCSNIIKEGFKKPCGHFICEKCNYEKNKCEKCNLNFNSNSMSKKELILENSEEKSIFTKIPKNKTNKSKNYNSFINLYNISSQKISGKKHLNKKRMYREIEKSDKKTYKETIDNLENLSIQDKILHNLNNLNNNNLINLNDNFFEKKLKSN